MGGDWHEPVANKEKQMEKELVEAQRLHWKRKNKTSPIFVVVFLLFLITILKLIKLIKKAKQNSHHFLNEKFNFFFQI